MNQQDEARYLNLMDQALESTNGIKMQCLDNADAQRHRLHMYKMRSEQRRMFQGVSRYDPLIFRLDGSNLKIVNGAAIGDYPVEEL